MNISCQQSCHPAASSLRQHPSTSIYALSDNKVAALPRAFEALLSKASCQSAIASQASVHSDVLTDTRWQRIFPRSKAFKTGNIKPGHPSFREGRHPSRNKIRMQCSENLVFLCRRLLGNSLFFAVLLPALRLLSVQACRPRCTSVSFIPRALCNQHKPKEQN